MEILAKNQYAQYEDFNKNHKNGNIMQSVKWADVKRGWQQEIIVTRDEKGDINAALAVIIKKIPLFGTTMMYAPRGPIMDYTDLKLMKKLQKGIDQLAKKYKAHIFKMDPNVLAENTDFVDFFKSMGYTQFAGATGFENIQTRFNFRLFLDGRSEEEILAGMHHKTRYNIRLAGRRGVEIKVVGTEGIGDFMHIMAVTGERDGFSIRSKEYFENMLTVLGDDIRLYAAYYEGKMIAGAITSNYAGRTDYIYGASDNEYRNVMAPYLLQWEMIKWAIETNCDVYDFLGVSGDMNEDGPLYGLYRFKNGFSGQVDELIGELDYTYKPTTSKVIKLALDANQKLRSLKRKLKNEPRS